MARRRNGGALEDIFEIAAALPWWVGTILAVIAYVVIHQYAVADVPTTTVPGQIGQMVVGQLTKTIAFYGQYIVPLMLLAGAAASYLGRRKRENLVQTVANGQSRDILRDMTWQDFELLVGEAFRMRGFAVAETGGGGADGGIDLVLKKGSEVFLVQCKQWQAFKVSVNVVRELFGVMAAQRATGGFVVTSGVFTADANSFAKGKNIELIEGTALTAMIKKVRAANSVLSSTGAVTRRAISPASTSPVSEPLCPRCGSAMLKRIAKQGPNAGGAFWECSTFPKCRGVIAIE